MIRLALRQLRHRLGRTLALAAGILVATTSFTVLTGAATTSRLEVRGTVARNFRAGYDLLVRPQGSATELERSAGLVRANFQSGVPGGISDAQYAAIRRLPGVDVAAPVSNVGYVLVEAEVPVSVSPYLTGAREQLFRVKPTWRSDRGTSTYVGAPQYVYVSRNRTRVVSFSKTRGHLYTASYHEYAEVVSGRSRPVPVCANYGFDQDAAVRTGTAPDTPFGYRSRYFAPLSCYYTSTEPDPNRSIGGAGDPRTPVATVPVDFPVLLAAVDPAAENALYGLQGAIVSGRPLPATAAPQPADHAPVVPVLAADRSFIDTSVGVTLQRVSAPAGGFAAVFARDAGLVQRVARLPGTTVKAAAPVAAGDLFARTTSAAVFGYWRVGDTRYDASGSVRRVQNPPDTYSLPYAPGMAPPGSDDVQLRPVTGVALDNQQPAIPSVHVVGRFDPARLSVPGALTGLSVETYSPAVLYGADASSRRALRGRSLLASGNVAGYPVQPPLLLTTLAAASVFHSSTYYPDDDRAAAPISVIRVRVADVRGPDPVSRERIKRVALAIQERTGLRVDVVAGASGVHRVVSLPPGNHGRPALTLAETWSKKGVALTVLRAVDRKSLALFGLILLVCALFVGNAAAAAVRTRRADLGVLSCLGWPVHQLFGAAIAELAVIGLASGVAGAVIALPLSAAAGVDMSWPRALFAIPAATALAVVAGIWPARTAARAAPLDAVRPAVRAPARARPVRRPADVALVDLRGSPGRTLLAVASVTIGIVALAVLLDITAAFRGAVTGSLLGDAVTVQVRRPDLVAVVVLLTLAGAVVADVLWLSVRERSREYATLAATGWADRSLAGVVVLEALLIGVAGGVLGGALAAAAVTRFAASCAGLVVPTALATCAAVAVAAVAALVPVWSLRRLPVARILSGE